MTRLTLLAAMLMSLVTSTAFAQTDIGTGKTWEFGLEPYLLASSIQGDASVGRVTGVPVDVSGFGVADGADFTWSASATVMFKMTEKLVLDFGYRAVGVDYDNGKAANDGFYAYDTITHGPLVGLLIKF